MQREFMGALPGLAGMGPARPATPRGGRPPSFPLWPQRCGAARSRLGFSSLSLLATPLPAPGRAAGYF